MNQTVQDAIKTRLQSIPEHPGVYRMLDAEGEVIYVGKARNLKRRVSSYFQKTHDTPKTRAMVAQVRQIEITVTHTETEALLLENNLIKSLRPRYNVVLRDDKSYPYIYVSTEQPFPRLGFHRGARTGSGRYFGPYPSAGAVRETLNLLQKLFPVRQCEDSFFRNRSRPCLQYQIKRCTGPCVDLVDAEIYAEDVRHAIMFLEGKSSEVNEELIRRMEDASQALEFERAARYRDQIGSLRRIQERQYVSGKGGDLDVIAAARAGGIGCVQVFYIRGGRNLGNKTYFPRNTEQTDPAGLIAAFVPQYYLGADNRQAREIPAQILVSHLPEDAAPLEEVLGQAANRRVRLQRPARGERLRWMRMAVSNAEHALAARLNTQASVVQRFEALQEALQLEDPPTRLECFDISHTMGEAPVASCVVFDTDGPLKSDYRRFNIRDITPGDDYAAMHQALTRRYRRLKEGEGKLPEVLFIDGGKGQVRQAVEVLEELQITGVTVIGVAKGVSRRPGLETLILSGGEGAIILPPDSPALHLIQQVRDEAHRFAITGHRQRRARGRRHSVLEEVPGLGPKRRQQLLRQFGGLQEVSRAGVEDLASVPGISRQLAQRIYDAFHSEGR